MLLNCGARECFWRVPWTARTSNQSILKEINIGYSLAGLMLKLKVQNFGHLIWRPWCWERLKARREVDDIGWEGWMASLTQWTWVWENSRRSWRKEKPGVATWGCRESDTSEQLNKNSYEVKKWDKNLINFLVRENS